MLNIEAGYTLSKELKELGMPLERCAPNVLHIEVFESVFRREYRQPMLWEVLDWLQKEKSLCVYTYPMTQWRKLAIRKTNGVLVKDIPLTKETSEEVAYRKGIQEAIEILKTIEKCPKVQD